MKYPTVEMVLAATIQYQEGKAGLGYDYSVEAIAPGDGLIGRATFKANATGTKLIPVHVVVKESFRRKGIATELYRKAEEIFQTPIVNRASHQTPDAKNFWSQSNRPFGNRTKAGAPEVSREDNVIDVRLPEGFAQGVILYDQADVKEKFQHHGVEPKVPPPIAYLELIEVAEDKQGKGYGGKILEAFMAEASRYADKIYLYATPSGGPYGPGEVTKAGESLISFYKSHGFQILKQKNQYDAVMWRKLPGFPTVSAVMAATKKIRQPESSDIRDAWKVIDSLLSPGKFNEGYKEWKAETKPLFDEAVKHGKLSLWPMDKAAREIRINDYKRRVELEAIDNPVIVAKLPPGATYYEMLDGSHRLITRAEAGYSDVPVFLIELPDEFSDLMAMEGDTLEDLGKYPTVKSVLAEYEDDIPYPTVDKILAADTWQDEGYTLSLNGDRDPRTAPGFDVLAKDPQGNVIGTATFIRDDRNGKLFVEWVRVDDAHQRKGLASAMYRLAEKASGRKIMRTNKNKTYEGKALWRQKHRGFGTIAAVLAGTIQYKKYVDEDGYLVVEAFDGSKRVGQLECKESQAEPGKLFPSGVKVDPAYRRQGIATRMYEMAVEETGLEFKDQLGRSPEGQAFRKAWDKKRAKSSAGRATRADADKLLALLRPALGNKADVKLVGSLTRKNKAKDIDILLIMRPENLTDQEMGNASTPGGEPMNDEPFWWPLFEKIGMELYECNGIWDDPETGEQHSMETWDWEGLVVDVFGDWGELG